MGLEFLGRVRKTSIAFGLFMSPFIATYWGLESAIGWLAGVVWSLVNIHLIAGLVRGFAGEDRSIGRTLLLGIAKFPLLYYAGYVLLSSGLFSAMSLVAGFVWPFMVTTLKALGRVILGLDDAGRSILDDNPDPRVGASR